MLWLSMADTPVWSVVYPEAVECMCGAESVSSVMHDHLLQLNMADMGFLVHKGCGVPC